MAYNQQQDRQRTALLTELGDTAANRMLTNPELIFKWLGSLGYAGSLLSRAALWGAANGIGITRALLDAGIIGGTPLVTTPYARVLFTETWGAPAVNIAELQFKNQSGSVLTGTPVFSTAGGVDTVAANAFDSSATTIWAPAIGDLSQSLGLLLTTPSAVKSISIQYASVDALSFEEGPRSFVVEFSDDGSAWTPMLTVSNEAAWAQAETRTYTIT